MEQVFTILMLVTLIGVLWAYKKRYERQWVAALISIAVAMSYLLYLIF